MYPFVQPGDHIALVAPSGPGSLAEVQDVQRIIEQTYAVNVTYLEDTHQKFAPLERADFLL